MALTRKEDKETKLSLVLSLIVTPNPYLSFSHVSTLIKHVKFGIGRPTHCLDNGRNPDM